MITLRDARKNMGYTQVQLAEMVGITTYKNNRHGRHTSPSYSMIENGRVMMSAALYLKLCEVLHVQPGVLELPKTNLYSKAMGCRHKRKRPAQPAGR